MKTKHTPGPWKASILEEGLFHIYGSVPEQLPIVVLDKRRDGYEPYRTQTTPANAHLIAAAPEMYEALLNIKRELIASGNWVARDYGWPANREAIESAIAKAEGKSL